MADNTLQTGSGNVAADLLTYEGDADALVQVIRPVHVTGSEGSHAVKEFLLAEDAAHSSGDIGVMGLTVRQNTAASLSGADADYQPLITDTNGRLHCLDANSAAIKTAVELIDNAISGTEMQCDIVGSLPAGTAAIGKLAANSGVDIGDVDVLSVGGTVTVDGSGVTQPVSGTVTETNSGAIKTAVELIDNAISGTEMQVDVVAALPAGTNAIGKLAANDGVDIGDVGAALTPQTTGGNSFFKSIDLDESEEQVKGTAGQVYSIFATNASTAALYLKVYNATAASVTVGTTVPDMTFALPPNDGGIHPKWVHGLAMSTAITVAATTGVADNGSGAPAANDVVCLVEYK